MSLHQYKLLKYDDCKLLYILTSCEIRSSTQSVRMMRHHQVMVYFVDLNLRLARSGNWGLNGVAPFQGGSGGKGFHLTPSLKNEQHRVKD